MTLEAQQPSQPPIDLYQDRKAPGYRESRQIQAARDLGMLYAASTTPIEPTHILEIGPGIGGVTSALRERFPNAPITSIDRDEDPQIATAARANGADFIQQDMLAISDSELQTLLAERKIDHVVALLTSGSVARHLLPQLQRIGFQGSVVLSLLTATELNHPIRPNQTPRAFAKEADRHNGTYVNLGDNVFKHEEGYVFHF